MRPPTALQARRMVALLEMLSEAAASGSGCPSNSAIADRLEMSSVTEVQSLLKRMTTEGLIRVDHTGNRRRATILATGEVADWTIYSRGRPMASAGKTAGSACIASAVRRLTPRECERLQGFPDDYTLVPYRKGLMADGPRYKALGNSMAVPVMRWIGA